MKGEATCGEDPNTPWKRVFRGCGGRGDVKGNTNKNTCIFQQYKQVFENLFLYLQSLHTSQFSNYILLGDFNVNFCNTNHPLYSKLYNIFSSFGLTQVVSEPIYPHMLQGKHIHEWLDSNVITTPASCSQVSLFPHCPTQITLVYCYVPNGDTLNHLLSILQELFGCTTMQTGLGLKS